MKIFKGKNLRDIKPADIERFKSNEEATLTRRGTKRKPATVLRELAVISKIFSLAVKNDFLDYNPCSRVDKPKFDNTQNRILLAQDKGKFFSSFKSDWAKDICTLVLNTGLRQNDALGLSKSNIDWESNTIRLIQGKTGRLVAIPMNNIVQKLIRSKWKNTGDLIFPSPKTGKVGVSCKKAMLGACSRAGILPVTIRDLRRTFGTRLR